MKPLCCLDNSSIPLVVDTSVAINLNASGCAAEVLTALPHQVLMVDVVSRELHNGQCKGRTDSEITSHFVATGVLSVVHLGNVGMSHFERLVTGDAARTLDDGEAATIAFAVEVGGIAVIDERKAINLCADLFADLPIASTLDLFSHQSIQGSLGQGILADAIFNALQGARMHVQAHHLGWVVSLIGNERAALCRSLPRGVRNIGSRTTTTRTYKYEKNGMDRPSETFEHPP